MILRPKHFRTIELLTGTDLRHGEIARRVGVSSRTLCRWLADGRFRAALECRRRLLPFHIEGLRLETARKLLLDVQRRLEAGEEKIPLKEVTQLLARLVGDNFDRVPDEPPTEGAVPKLTPEQAEALWAEIGREEAAEKSALAAPTCGS